MSDRPPPKKRSGPANRPHGSGGLGQDQQDRNLQGIGPAVVDAFLSAGVKRKPSQDQPEGGLFAPAPTSTGELPELTLPRNPDSLGDFRARPDSAEVKAKFNKIKALAESVRQQTEAQAAAPAGPDEPPTGPKTPGTRPLGTAPLDPMRQQLLAKRGQPPTRPGTAPLEGNDTKLQHLAMRAKAKGSNGTRPLDKLEKSVEAVLGEKGAVRLRQSIKALEDKALPGRLGALADSINSLLPEGSERYLKLGAEVGKQVLQNNVNPVLAVGMSLKEAGERLKELEKWGELSNKERIANMAMLTSNLSEILGAVTPPPVNYGIQVLGAGMLLMGMATEHSECVEDLAKVTGADKLAKSKATGPLASRVQEAWDELGERLKKKAKPRLPAQLQAVIESPMWKQAKQHPMGAKFAQGAENVLYNLARRKEAFEASWDHRLDKVKQAKAKTKATGKKKPAAEE